MLNYNWCDNRLGLRSLAGFLFDSIPDLDLTPPVLVPADFYAQKLDGLQIVDAAFTVFTFFKFII